MSTYDPNGIGGTEVADDGNTIKITFETADSGLMTVNLPVSLSGHLIRLLSARTIEAHKQLQGAGKKTEFLSEIADVKTLSVGGAKGYADPILSLETKDGIVTSYQVPANIMQRLAVGLTKLFAGEKPS